VSSAAFERIGAYALTWLALFVANRHHNPRSYGWLMVAVYPCGKSGG
jgi:hypothetical protein